jgi:hypothetical protein
VQAGAVGASAGTANGAAAGAISVLGAAGGAASTDGTGGAGTTISLTAGAGGAAAGSSSDAGGAGGDVSVTAGASGAGADNSTGTKGGSVTVSAGDGSNVDSGNGGTHGAGGDITLDAGDEGTGTAGAADHGTIYHKIDGTTCWYVTGKTTSASDTLGDLLPGADDTYSIGKSTARAKGLYTKDVFGAAEIVFRPNQAEFPTSAYATPDTRNGRPCIDFDDGTSTNDEACYFSGVMPDGYISGHDLDVTLVWAATSATTNEVRWFVDLERVNTTLDVDTDSFSGNGETSDETCPGTNGYVKYSTLTLNGSSLDGVQAGEYFRLKVQRIGTHGNDDMTGDAELFVVHIKEGDA